MGRSRLLSISLAAATLNSSSIPISLLMEAEKKKSQELECMAKLKHFIPYLQKNKEKLEKRKTISDNPEDEWCEELEAMHSRGEELQQKMPVYSSVLVGSVAQLKEQSFVHQNFKINALRDRKPMKSLKDGGYVLVLASKSEELGHHSLAVSLFHQFDINANPGDVIKNNHPTVISWMIWRTFYLSIELSELLKFISFKIYNSKVTSHPIIGKIVNFINFKISQKSFRTHFKDLPSKFDIISCSNCIELIFLCNNSRFLDQKSIRGALEVQFSKLSHDTVNQGSRDLLSIKIVPKNLSQRIGNALNEIYGNSLKVCKYSTNHNDMKPKNEFEKVNHANHGEKAVAESNSSLNNDIVINNSSEKSENVAVNSESHETKEEIQITSGTLKNSKPDEIVLNSDLTNENSNPEINQDESSSKDDSNENFNGFTNEVEKSKHFSDKLGNNDATTFSPIIETCESISKFENSGDMLSEFNEDVAEDPSVNLLQSLLTDKISPKTRNVFIKETTITSVKNNVTSSNNDAGSENCNLNSQSANKTECERKQPDKSIVNTGKKDSTNLSIDPTKHPNSKIDVDNVKIGNPTSSPDTSFLIHHNDKSIWDIVSANIPNKKESNKYGCPLCSDFKNETTAALKSHLNRHAGYQPCNCSMCNGSKLPETDKMNSEENLESLCGKDIKTEQEISNLMNKIIAECQKSTTKRKRTSEEIHGKRIKLNEDGSSADSSKIVLPEESGFQSFSEDLKNAVCKLEELKNEKISMVSSPSAHQLNDVGEDLVMLDAAINEKLQVKVEKDDEDTEENSSHNMVSFPAMNNENNLDNSFPFHITNVKMERTDLDESNEDEFNSAFFDNFNSFIPQLKVRRKTRRPQSSSSSDFSPYECSFCGLCYKSLSTYRLHTYRHFKEYAIYRCNYCRKGFMRKDHVRAHMYGTHPKEEIKYEMVDPPDDPVILLTIPKPRNSSAEFVKTRISSVAEVFKCAFCDFTCVPGDLTAHFESCHPNEVPQMRILKDNLCPDKIVPLPVPVDSKPVKRNRVVAKKSTSSKFSSAKRCVALKSTSKKSQSLAGSSVDVRKCDVKKQDFDKLKIWIHSRSIFLSVKDLMKMFNMNCYVRLIDLKKLF
ncbi:hypothetical protein GQR58_025091 [Nymphon striatum]|nr:hypothetical protein GQR58_025091 [Nymphon striatum]